MPTTETYMVDLTFTRHNLTTDAVEYISSTAYSPAEVEDEVDTMTAQGWTLYMSLVV